MEYTHTDSRHWLKNLFAESSNKGFDSKPMSVLKYILQYLSNPVEWNVDLDCKMWQYEQHNMLNLWNVSKCLMMVWIMPVSI